MASLAVVVADLRSRGARTTPAPAAIREYRGWSVGYSADASVVMLSARWTRSSATVDDWKSLGEILRAFDCPDPDACAIGDSVKTNAAAVHKWAWTLDTDGTARPLKRNDDGNGFAAPDSGTSTAEA